MDELLSSDIEAKMSSSRSRLGGWNNWITFPFIIGLSLSYTNHVVLIYIRTISFKRHYASALHPIISVPFG